MKTDTENLKNVHTTIYIQNNFKRVKKPHVRLGYEYNTLIDTHENLHALYVQQMYKIDELQTEVDRLHNMMYSHTVVEKCQGFGKSRGII
jgi:hypothetical protein